MGVPRPTIVCGDIGIRLVAFKVGILGLGTVGTGTVQLLLDATGRHPLLQERRFTLVPLAEVAPNLVHPVLHKTTNELLINCSDDSEVIKFS